MVGQQISHYTLLEKLGEGGMGEVYLAEDSKLERKVALKFLPGHVSIDAEANARFLREAKAAAALNHPNIITIHEIGDFEGRAYIAMEYLDGQSLRDLVRATGPVVPTKIFDIFNQICDGLAKAHAAGIVHRDLKPENIMLDADGKVRILDFGLARIAGKSRLTSARSTIGTLLYMAPEHFEGDQIDQRADIWALGVMLYELLAGKLPFDGEYEQPIIYSIVNEEPEPLTRSRPDLPADMQRVLDKALDKDRDTRYQSIADLQADFQRIQACEVVAAKPMSGKRKRQLKHTALRFAGLAAVVVLAVVAGIGIFKPEPVPRVPVKHTQVTFVGNASHPAISPDGQFVAYVTGKIMSGQNAMVQDLSGRQALKIFEGLGVDGLRWSPDGTEILLGNADSTGWHTTLVPRLGGRPRRIEEVGGFKCWSPDGSQFAYAAGNWKTIYIMSTSTYKNAFLTLTGSFSWMWEFDWSPLGDRFAFTTKDHEMYTIQTIKIDGSQQEIVVEDSLALFPPNWSANGQTIYYLRSDGQTRNLMKVDINTKTGKAEGPPSTLLSGVSFGDNSQLSDDNKRLLYTREIHSRNLWLVTLKEEAGKINFDTKQLTTGTSWNHSPAISPDGNRIVFSIGKHPRAELYTMPINGGQIQQLTFMNRYNSGANWSPDGKEIVFGSTHGEKNKVWRINATGGTPRPFANSELSNEPFQLTMARKSGILYQRPRNRNYHFLDPTTEQEKPLLSKEIGWLFQPRFSPDEKQVALHVNDFSQTKYGIWLVSNINGSSKLLQKGFLYPMKWSNDGKWIWAYSVDTEQTQILKIPVKGGSAQIVITLPWEIASDLAVAAMSPDEKHLVVPVAQHQSDVWLAEHFDPVNELEAPISMPKVPEMRQLTYLQNGQDFWRQRKYDEAEKAFREGLEINPEHLMLSRQLGFLLGRQKKYSEAESVFRKSNVFHPEHPGLLIGLGQNLNNQQKYIEAEAIFRKGLTLHPEHAGLLNGLGWSLNWQRKYVQAEEIFRQGLEFDPNNIALLNGMQTAALENRNYEAAKKYGEEYLAQAKSPNSKSLQHVKLGALGILLKDFSYAEQHYKNALAIDSTYSQAIRGMGYLFAEQNRFIEAQKYALQAVGLDSSFANFNLAAWISVTGEIDITSGIALAEKARASKPDFWAQRFETYPYLAIPEHTIGLAYLKKGEYKKAVQYLERAAEFAPERQAVLNDLQRAKMRANE